MNVMLNCMKYNPLLQMPSYWLLLLQQPVKQGKAIMEILLMDSPFIIYESPDKPNIAYSVFYMSRDESLQKYFEWLVKELLEHGINSTRTIIY